MVPGATGRGHVNNSPPSKDKDHDHEGQSGLRTAGGWRPIVLTIFGAMILAGIAGFPIVATTTNERTQIATMALGAARQARVDITLGAGHLRVAGGSIAGTGAPMPREELLRGEFTMAVDAETPAMVYEMAGNVGHLTIDQASDEAFAWPWEHHDLLWDLALNPTVPTALAIEMGAGDLELYLGGMTLTDLDVSIGAGETMLDFSGDWPHELTASVESGAGDLTVLVPRQIGVRIELDQGAGSTKAKGLTEADDVYVNDAYGQTATTLNLKLHHGAGEVRLEVV